MADSPSNSLKRPHPEDQQQHEGAQKKIRSTNGSPIPQPNGATAGKPDMAKIIAEAKARASKIAAKMESTSTRTDSGLAAKHSLSASTESSGLSRADQLKARVAAALNSKSSDQRTPLYQAPTEEAMSRARGGLGIGLHPSLLDSSQGSSKSKQAIPPKFATAIANRTQSPSASAQTPKKILDLSGPDLSEIRANPYFDTSHGAISATLKARNRRELAFNQKGKYLQMGQALRRQAAIEQLRQRVAQQARKVGLDDDPSEKGWKIEEPPSVEWWEEALLVSNNYDELDKAKIDTEDSIITAFVQHPVLIEPPSIKNMAPSKPLPLTKQEMAKKRRMTRMANLKEEQAKQRLGLIETPEPKVKLGNMMRVMGEEAVKDPTAVEAKVNRGIAERKATHEQMNEDRKLTKEQEHEKLEQKQAQDAAKGIHVACFKIDSLANGRHKFKVNKNAEQVSDWRLKIRRHPADVEQMALTGCVVTSPKQTLVIAEAGMHSIQAFKKLMLQRIAWSENDPAPVREGNRRAKESWLQPEEEDGTLKDLTSNRCTLLWEGEAKERAWRAWKFKPVESDKQALEALSRAKMENFWTQAKGVQ